MTVTFSGLRRSPISTPGNQQPLSLPLVVGNPVYNPVGNPDACVRLAGYPSGLCTGLSITPTPLSSAISSHIPNVLNYSRDRGHRQEG